MANKQNKTSSTMDEQILRWLNGTKRPFDQILSPAETLCCSCDNSKMLTTPKRRRITDDDDDNAGPTPRASDASSQPSRNSSPSKQLSSLRLGDSSIEVKALMVDDEDIPARELVSTLEDTGRGHGILPLSWKTAGHDQFKERQWRFAFMEPDQSDDFPGRIPEPDAIKQILSNAAECQENNHEEFSWNSKVHLRLLDCILDGWENHGEKYHAMTCITAKPHREFKVRSVSIKMIDLCVSASIDDDEWKQRIARFSRTTPTGTVNHTDFDPTRSRPILLSIETKKPGINWEAAQLQIAIWLYAQWSFLSWAVVQNLACEGTPVAELQEKGRDVLLELPFIPGIIIQGHRWLLVISTYSDGKMQLWTDVELGTTQSSLGIYSTIAGVRRVAGWARDVYLPWFRKHVLPPL